MGNLLFSFGRLPCSFLTGFGVLFLFLSDQSLVVGIDGGGIIAHIFGDPNLLISFFLKGGNPHFKQEIILFIDQRLVMFPDALGFLARFLCNLYLLIAFFLQSSDAVLDASLSEFIELVNPGLFALGSFLIQLRKIIFELQVYLAYGFCQAVLDLLDRLGGRSDLLQAFLVSLRLFFQSGDLILGLLAESILFCGLEVKERVLPRFEDALLLLKPSSFQSRNIFIELLVNGQYLGSLALLNNGNELSVSFGRFDGFFCSLLNRSNSRVGALRQQLFFAQREFCQLVIPFTVQRFFFL